MDLSFWLTTVSLLCAAYAGGQWIYTVYIKKVAVAQPSVDIEDAAPPASGALTRLTTQQWMSDLNELPDTFPHLFVVGPTGSGKTTFTTALLSTRKGALVVITPKPDDQWGGLASVTIDDDASFRSVQQMFSSLNSELKQRLVAVKRGQPCGSPLTIVLDDAPALLSEGGKEAASLLKLVARLGRSFRVRLVLLSQSDRVKALGLEGEGDALDNFTRVQLAAGHAGATWQARGTTYQLDLLHVARLAKNDLSGRSWGGLEPVRLPDGGQNEGIEPVREPVRELVRNEIPDTDAVRTGTVVLDDDRLIAELVRRGVSANRIADTLGGTRQTILERVRRVKEDGCN